MTLPTLHLIGVYNADGGLLGELSYVWEKLIGRRTCALCDLTHGTFAEKNSVRRWRQEQWPQISFCHLNELSIEQRHIVGGDAPCVLLIDRSDIVRLVTRKELGDLHGDEYGFFQLIDGKLKNWGFSGEQLDRDEASPLGCRDLPNRP